MLESGQCDSTLCGGKSCACVTWIELHGTCDRSCYFHPVHTYMYRVCGQTCMYMEINLFAIAESMTSPLLLEVFGGMYKSHLIALFLVTTDP